MLVKRRSWILSPSSAVDKLDAVRIIIVMMRIIIIWCCRSHYLWSVLDYYMIICTLALRLSFNLNYFDYISV